MYLTYFLSLYPLADQNREFLYKTASLQQEGDINFHVKNILVNLSTSKLLFAAYFPFILT